MLSTIFKNIFIKTAANTTDNWWDNDINRIINNYRSDLLDQWESATDAKDKQNLRTRLGWLNDDKNVALILQAYKANPKAMPSYTTALDYINSLKLGYLNLGKSLVTLNPIQEAYSKRYLDRDRLFSSLTKQKSVDDINSELNGGFFTNLYRRWFDSDGKSFKDLIGHDLMQVRRTAVQLGSYLTPLFLLKINKSDYGDLSKLNIFNNEAFTKMDPVHRAAFAQSLSLSLLTQLDALPNDQDKLKHINNLIAVATKLKIPKGVVNEGLKLRIKLEVTKQAWKVVKEDWTKFNKFVAIWARSKGWDNFAKFADNLLAFYGTVAATILGGGLLTATAIGGIRNNYQQGPAAPAPRATGQQYGYYG